MIRTLQPDDKASVIALVHASGMFSEDEADFIATIYDQGQTSAIWFGAFEQDTMTGVAYCMPMEMTNRTWNVLMLLVHPEHHRQGIGQALMRLMEQTLADQSQRLLMVETSSGEEFETARQFYRAIGYQRQGTVEDQDDDGDDKLTFTRKL